MSYGGILLHEQRKHFSSVVSNDCLVDGTTLASEFLECETIPLLETAKPSIGKLETSSAQKVGYCLSLVFFLYNVAQGWQFTAHIFLQPKLQSHLKFGVAPLWSHLWAFLSDAL